jgi:hypothetical protein
LHAAEALAASVILAIFTSSAAVNWPRRRVSEVGDVVNGFGFAESLQGRRGLPFPFVKVSDMNAAGAETVVTSAANTVDDNILRTLRARVYPAGTVIFPKVGGALLTNKKRILGVGATFDNNVMGIVPRTAESRWIFHWLRTIDLAALSNTQALPSIRQSAVAALELPVPPLAVQRNTVAELEAQLATSTKIEARAREELESITQMPSAMLREAFNGDR